ELRERNRLAVLADDPLKQVSGPQSRRPDQWFYLDGSPHHCVPIPARRPGVDNDLGVMDDVLALGGLPIRFGLDVENPDAGLCGGPCRRPDCPVLTLARLQRGGEVDELAVDESAEASRLLHLHDWPTFHRMREHKLDIY